LKGTHLKSVYLQFRIKDFDFDEQMKDVIGQYTDNVQQIYWGDVSELNSLVEEIYEWMMGKPPSFRIIKFLSNRKIADADFE